MEPSKKTVSLKKRWLKRLTRYKISNTSTTSTDSQSSDTSSQKNVVEQNGLDNRKNSRGGVFGSLRRVHNRVKLCVSKHKVRTVDTVGNTNAFNSNPNLEVQHVNSANLPETTQVSGILGNFVI